MTWLPTLAEQELYDEAQGPRRPRSRRRVPGEWDDPTFVAVEIDEDYMERETKRAIGAKVCCRAFNDVDLERQQQWRFQALHQLAHSRVAFTTDYFADVARIERDEAAVMLEEARQAKWIARVDPLWIGTLGSRR